MSYIIRWVGGVNAGGFDDMMAAAHAIVASGQESIVQIREQMSDKVVATVPLDMLLEMRRIKMSRWAKEAWKDESSTKPMRLIAYWIDLCGYYVNDETGTVWAKTTASRVWINQGPVAQFLHRIADKKIRGELV